MNKLRHRIIQFFAAEKQSRLVPINLQARVRSSKHSGKLSKPTLDLINIFSEFTT